MSLTSCQVMPGPLVDRSMQTSELAMCNRCWQKIHPGGITFSDAPALEKHKGTLFTTP